MRTSLAIRARAPHMAVLDLAQYALDTALWALIDDFPALQGDPHPWRPEPPDQLAARRLLRQIRTFSRAVRQYRRTLAASLDSPQPSPTHDDVDF